ncbi:hypothetical protein C0995_004834 [Termitomyces sp. Mi166|nr:hypothetical protein C0995_004834 [Termitomyces sp. Mi166\
MLGLEESDSEDEAKLQGKQKQGGDNLEDDFVDDEWDKLGAGLSETVNVNKAEVPGSEKEGSSEDDNEEDEGKDEGDSKNEAEEEEHEDLIQVKKSTSQSLTKGKAKELPFIFPCPSSHEEFLSIMNDVSNDNVPTVIKQICTLYHMSLNFKKKFKLQTLAMILIDHILYITTPPQSQFSLISLMLPHLKALTKAYSIQVAEHFVEKLSLMQKKT